MCSSPLSGADEGDTAYHLTISGSSSFIGEDPGVDGGWLFSVIEIAESAECGIALFQRVTTVDA